MFQRNVSGYFNIQHYAFMLNGYKIVSTLHKLVASGLDINAPRWLEVAKTIKKNPISV